MDPYEQFDESLRKAAEAFKAIDKNEIIRVISHLDADGISACSIMLRLLNIENRKYSVSTVQQVNDVLLEQLAKEQYNYIIFTDLGSGVIKEINKILSNKKVFVLDHHSIETNDFGNIVL